MKFINDYHNSIKNTKTLRFTKGNKAILENFFFSIILFLLFTHLVFSIFANQNEKAKRIVDEVDFDFCEMKIGAKPININDLGFKPILKSSNEFLLSWLRKNYGDK